MGAQVTLATKTYDEKGNLIPLSINKKQFISFSYDGKNIEDFDLLAIFSNGRLDKEIYFPFSDVTSKNEALDGQQYWGSTFEAGRLSFNLATDGMTSENYEAFKNHFIPGKIAELILSEFPNRAIKARVAAAPRISLLPFEEKRIVKIGSKEKEISTSLYKGDASIEFVMDNPYWYSVRQYIDDSATNYDYSEEEIKIIHEDGIPALSMFNTEKQIFLGGNYIVNLADEKLSYRVNDELYLYNCGTIAAKPVIKFTITPIFYNNKIVFPNKDNSKDANFTIGKNSLKFTTPNIITAYNQAVKIITNYGLEGGSVIELRNQLRDNLHNYYTRSYMLALLNSFIEGKSLVVNGKIQKGFDNAFLGEMKTFLKDDDSKTKPLTCIFDSQNGETLIEISCKVFGKDEPLYIVENAGDMLKSKYLKIEGRTLPTEGYITNEKCLKVSSDCDLEDVSIDFKYNYL